MRNNNVDMVVYNQNGERQPMKKGYSRKAQFAVMFVIVLIILLGFSLPMKNEVETVNSNKQIDSMETITYNTSYYTDIDSSVANQLDHVEAEMIEKPKEEYISLGTFRITAYCGCEKCCGKYGVNRPVDEDGETIVYTASGKRAKEGVTVAADRSLLPFGTKLYIDGNEFEVQDVGGGIKGNELDMYFESHQDALNFGVQHIEVFVKSN